MSDSTPRSEGTYGEAAFGPGGPADVPADYVSGGPGGHPPYQPPPRQRDSRRGLIAVILAAVLSLVLAGGAFAFYSADPFHLFRAGPQAAEAVPADALFYAGVDLNPSAEQKVSALRFLNHFPVFREGSGLDDANADVRRVIFEHSLQTLHCRGLSYAADVEPWIGSKFGIAGMPSPNGTSSPIGVGVVEVTEKDAAKAGLAKIGRCLGGRDETSASFGFSFVGDYALVAETQAQADRYASRAQSSPLADNADFSADMASLGDLGVATVWANVSGAIDAYGQGLASASQSDFLKSTYQRAAATFRFTGDSAEIVTSVLGKTSATTHGANQIVRLPDTTVFAVSEAGGAKRLDTSWDDLMAGAQSGGADGSNSVDAFEAETGLHLPGDLRTLLGDNVLLAVDSRGLTAQALKDGDMSTLNAGLRFTSDPVKLNAIYDKIRTLVENRAGQSLPVVKVDADDGMAVATNDSYAKTLAGLDGNLGDAQEFQSVTDDAVSKEQVLFFNWDSVETQILTAAKNSGAPKSVIDNLRPLRAFGVTSSGAGRYTVSTLRLSVND
jgi:Protein of unknown function (DUF3352)